MSTSEQPDRYTLKKVGKFWLLGKPGKKDFKVCPLLTHAKEVYTSENFIIADENVYEIKEVEHEELLLVNVDEIKVCDQQNVNTQGNKPFFRYDRETKYDSGESLVQNNAEETHFNTEYDIIKVTDESELEQMHDKYSSLEETGQTEDTSLIDKKVTDELEQMRDEYSSLEETGQTEDTSLIAFGFASKNKEDLYQRGIEHTSLLEEAQAQGCSPTRNFELAGKKYGYFEHNSQTYTKDAGYNKSDSVSNNGTSVRFLDKFKQDVARLHTPGGISEQNSPKDSDNAGSNKRTYGFSRQFSWSTRAKAVCVYETKEKITVKVYSSDILWVPVDCIAHAANEDLQPGGGIARAIADAAGKDLTKEGRDYLKQHGKIRVGEVCHTGAGKMSYKYVIHAVGPCWSDYKPYSLRDVERCEADLYNAVINSLSEAEKLKMETIAVSSISSGIDGCPLDLCSIQYAKAVVDYSRCSKSPLKEIHFVDTNMEMVQVMHEIFQSMIPKQRIPKSYNKMKYVKLEATYSKEDMYKRGFIGELFNDVKDARDKVFNLLLPPRGYSEQNIPKDTKDTDSYQKTPGFSRQFSWSTRAKALYVFETKDKITVKVYSSDILFVPVDCIVNAANEDLKHGGGIARAIADAAGKDLNKEGRDYLKQHGKLRVGEVCHTGAGRMSYNYVIHAVGPCWSDYKPYSLSDVEKCETDLYNAVINSLSEAEKLMMETIAVSSISSGIYGCPLDLCSIQYAKAVVDYSRCSKSPLKEIHFVDTNMEMVQVMHETFQSMIPNERIPRSYDKMKYVQLGETYCRDKTSARNQHHTPGIKDADDFHKFDKGHSGWVIYPYCHRDYPPGFSKKAFSCCVGPGQNIYIYTADILNMTFKDMIACGNTPTSKTSGYLANAIQKKGGDVYDAEMTKMFDSRPKEGDVVVCKSGGLRNFKWVVHVILPDFKTHSSKEDVEFKVASSFRNIFLEMKSKDCHSIALPLVGTGTGNADPVLYGWRFFEALCDFSSSNKEYAFKVHLVHYDKKSTDKAIETINKACRDIRPIQIITNRRAPKSGKTRWAYEVRPKYAGFNYFEEHNSTETGEESEKWPKERTRSGNTLDSPDED